jgi:cytoskeletal protein CcmA (bactofilin family)
VDPTPVFSEVLFPAGCEAHGTLRLEKSIRFEGEFHGRIISKGTVVIEADGAVEADIRARTVIVWGAVQGDIDASREVIVHGAARIHGAIRTPSLVVERGAFLAGRTDMYRPLAPPATAPSLQPRAAVRASTPHERKPHAPAPAAGAPTA